MDFALKLMGIVQNMSNGRFSKICMAIFARIPTETASIALLILLPLAACVNSWMLCVIKKKTFKVCSALKWMYLVSALPLSAFCLYFNTVHTFYYYSGQTDGTSAGYVIGMGGTTLAGISGLIALASVPIWIFNLIL